MPPVAKKAQPKVKVEDTELPDAIEPETPDLPDDEPDSDVSKNGDEIESPQVTPDVDEDVAPAKVPDAPAPDSGLVQVFDPCFVCYPQGWPTREEGAFANCPHEHAIVYGQAVLITRERALELGFVEIPKE